MHSIPAPALRNPSTRADLTNVIFPKNEVTSPLIEVDDYTHYDDEGTRLPFEQANVKFLYGPQRLVIGRFTAGSVVTKDVAPDEIVAGNPARHIRKRLEDADIQRLLAVRWWDWPIEQITEHAAVIMAGTVEEPDELA